MSDKRKSTSSKPTAQAILQPHPHRNSPQPRHNENDFKPIAIKTSSLSITPLKPSSPTLSAGANRRHNTYFADAPNSTSMDDMDQSRQGYDENKAEDASEIDTAGLESQISQRSPTKDDNALKSTNSDHSEDAKTLTDMISSDGRNIEETNGLGGRPAKQIPRRQTPSAAGKRRSVLQKYLPWDYATEAERGGGRINRIRKRRVFNRADPKAYFSSERTTYAWMYLHILTLSFGLSLYAYPQTIGHKFPPTHIAATIASGVSLIFVLATAAQFHRRQHRLAELHKEGHEKSAEVFDESVHRFPTIVTIFVVAVMVINIICIWSTPTYDMKNRTSFSG